MRRARITDVEPTGELIPTIDTGENEYDSVLGVYTLFVSMPRAETVYFRLVVEAWEDYAVARTVERYYGPERKRSLVVVMAVPDYLGPCSRSLARLVAEIGAWQVPASPALRDALRRDLLGDSPAG
jgi:hypothetical protein